MNSLKPFNKTGNLTALTLYKNEVTLKKAKNKKKCRFNQHVTINQNNVSCGNQWERHQLELKYKFVA